VSPGVVLAVDGGNFKTHLALLRADGGLLALVRGPHSSPHQIGVEGCADLLEGMLADAAGSAGLERTDGPVAEVGHVMLAGADLPVEEQSLQRAIAARGWARRVTVANDTFAVLRAGTERGWGIALVCGAGLNCVGVAADGRQTRFPTLGTITGDWGGGEDVGLAGLAAAARSEDGRGPRTSLQMTLPPHFEFTTPREVAEAIHLDGLPRQRVAELAPIVLREAEHDAVAAGIAERLVSEAVAMVRVARERLDLTREPVDVVLGGGMLRHDGGMLVGKIGERLGVAAPNAVVRMVDAPPIVGAALLGLDEIDAGEQARERATAELSTAAGEGEELIHG
jgi:N-acetylglucosamine kinase-like BadF-type ATPase